MTIADGQNIDAHVNLGVLPFGLALSSPIQIRAAPSNKVPVHLYISHYIQQSHEPQTTPLEAETDLQQR